MPDQRLSIDDIEPLHRQDDDAASFFIRRCTSEIIARIVLDDPSLVFLYDFGGPVGGPSWHEWRKFPFPLQPDDGAECSPRLVRMLQAQLLFTISEFKQLATKSAWNGFRLIQLDSDPGQMHDFEGLGMMDRARRRHLVQEYGVALSVTFPHHRESTLFWSPAAEYAARLRERAVALCNG